MVRLFAVKFLSEFWIIMPVLVPLYKANGLSAAQILLTQTAYSLSQMILEVPSGYFSDRYGRRRTLIAAGVFFFIGITMYAFSNGFWQFVAAEVVLGIAGSLVSGTDIAFIYDTLKESNTESRYTFFAGRAEFWCRLGTGAGSVLGGALAAIATVRLPFYFNMGTSLLLIAFAVSLKEPERTKMPAGHSLRAIVNVIRLCLGNRHILTTMLLSACIMSTGVIAIWGYFLFFGRIHLPLFWNGTLFAAMQTVSAFSARHAETLVSKIGENRVYALFGLPGIVFLIFGTASGALVLPLLFVHSAVWGLSTPLLTKRINQFVSSDIRATALSVNAMTGRILYITGGPIFGYAADRGSLSSAFLLIAVFYLLMAPVLLIAMRRKNT